MKNLTIIFTLTVAALIAGCKNSPVDKSQLVNPLLGDISYERKFGHKPNSTTDNNLRVRTHLEYAENLLRNKDVSGLSAELKTKRNHLLNLLHNYWTNGVFPKNYDYTDQRKPCFIDKDGTICAVGYLVEQTTSRKVAENINSKHKYDEVLAMNDQTVDNWVLTSGLTKEECAMIQPTYGSPFPIYYESNNITTANGIASSVFSGVNLTLCALNKIQISKPSTTKAVATIGIVTGIGQIIYGIKSYPENIDAGFNTYQTNEGQKKLSIINIGIGTSTLLLSTWNLLINKKTKSKSTSWNLENFRTPDNNSGLALTMIRNF